MNCISTVISGDYQHYIPFYLLSAKGWIKNVDVNFFLYDTIDDITLEAVGYLENSGIINKVKIKENCFKNRKQEHANSLRFLVSEGIDDYDLTLITDIDFLVFDDPIHWHSEEMLLTYRPFAGHHGARKHPLRKEISKDGWVGGFERTCGGMFAVNRKWYSMTHEARVYFIKHLDTECHYREYDEVMLSRMIKMIGYDVPHIKNFYRDIRLIHLGDFRTGMEHRYKNAEKLNKRISVKTAENYNNFIKTKEFKDVFDIMKKSETIRTVFTNLNKYMRQRDEQVYSEQT